MSQNPPESTPFIPSHCLYPSQGIQNFRHNYGIKPVFHGKISAFGITHPRKVGISPKILAYWHNCFFSKKNKKIGFLWAKCLFLQHYFFPAMYNGPRKTGEGRN